MIQSKGKTYLKNAALLTSSGLVLRVLGMVFRVYIAASLGSEGMGLYQLILSVYTVFVSLASAGINVASTRLAAQSLARGRGMAPTLWGLVTAAAGLGTLAMVGQFALCGPLSRFLLHDARAELGLKMLAPSLPFVAVAGALRGCFLARRRVEPNVVAQLLEQLIRMVVSLALLRRYASWGAGYGCAAVLMGNTVSEAISCLIVALFARGEPAFRRRSDDPARGYSRRELAAIVLPVGGSRILSSGLQAMESTLIPLCLALYLGERGLAVSQYGALKGMAIPLIFFPFSVLAALSSLLMPEITRAYTRKDREGCGRLIDAMMRATGLFSALAGAALVLFGQELAQLLYGDPQVGEYVRVLGAIAPFMYLESMVDGVLKGLGEQMATFRYSVVDSCLRIAGILLLVPRFGIWGFLGVMVCSNLLTCLLNTRRMLQRSAIQANWGGWIGLPLCFAAGGAGAALGVSRLGWQGWPGLIAQAAALCVGFCLPMAVLWQKNKAAFALLAKRPRHTSEN